MLRRWVTFLALVVASPLLAPFACDETPRGEQGIDLVPPEGGFEDSGGPVLDAEVPCREVGDAGPCAQALGQGSLYTHLIACTPGQSPAYIDCDELDASDPLAGEDGGAAFCCTTGLI